MNTLHKISILFVLSALLFSSTSLIGQPSFSRAGDIPLYVNGKKLRNPWAGGLNNPQFSTVKLDNDITEDLFVYDRSRDKIITFLYRDSSGQGHYRHAPRFEKLFPDLRHWVLLRDYNCDGKKDIFTTTHPGVKVYRNERSPGNPLQFSLASPLLEFSGRILYVSQWDIPAIHDIDGDGDLDILTFNITGSFLIYFKNTSVEKQGNCDSLHYKLETACWGKFRENFGNCGIRLGIDCEFEDPSPGSSGKKKHAGSTVLAYDHDGDRDSDLLLGDIGCTEMKFLKNGGDTSYSEIVEIEKAFPVSHPVDISHFPAAFHLDVNKDGVNDLLAAPNALNVSHNTQSSWYYQNTGSNTDPRYEFKTSSFLQNEMLDLGEGAYPVSFDYNNDSLPDLVIGNYGYFSDTSNYRGALALLENTGTTDSPAFRMVTRNWLDIESLGLTGPYPAFGDLDGDGDPDLLLGESKGTFIFFENTAPKGQAPDFASPQKNWKDLKTGLFCTPQIVDINKDGKNDIITGKKNGKVSYFKNSGTKRAPAFTLVTDSFAQIDVRKKDQPSGYSVPCLVRIDSSGKENLLVGGISGYIYRYIRNDQGDFELFDTAFENIYEGKRSAVSAGDLNGDRAPDLLTGNYGGGMAVYYNPLSPPPPSYPVPTSLELQVFPNPVLHSLNVKLLSPQVPNSIQLTLFNLTGQPVLRRKTMKNYQVNPFRIKLDKFSPGLYLLNVRIPGHEWWKKIVIY